MKRKRLIILGLSILAIAALAFLSSLFHQEVPKNTIRILIERPMGANHLKIESLILEKHYSYVSHGEDFDLMPPDPAKPILSFHVVQDENTRALIFLKGEADVLYNSLSIAKTVWVESKNVPHDTHILSHSGDSISHLALNSESPALQDPAIKAAILTALPIKLWRETVFSNWVEPMQPENEDARIEALHQINIPSGLTLRYLTTASREGQQLAFLTREALGKIGITVNVQVFESALFYAKIRKREFDLFSARSLPGVKNALDLPHTELIPLFRWKHGLILNSRVHAPATLEDSLDYSFRFLSELQLPSRP